MIFEDIANVMNARPVKEIMRKTGLTKNRVYSLRMGCTFHMDYELLFALQRMGYEVRVFAVGDPARRSRDGDGKIPAPVGPMCWPTPLSLRSSVAPRPTTRRLSPFGSISLRETARSVVASAGAGTGSRVWEKRKVPRFRGADYEICRWRYFLNVKKVTKEHRGRSVRLKNHDFKFRIKS